MFVSIIGKVSSGSTNTKHSSILNGFVLNDEKMNKGLHNEKAYTQRRRVNENPLETR
jgi:hypothetical protein